MIEIEWTDKQLKAAGISKRKLTSIVRRQNELAKEMAELNLRLFVAAGHPVITKAWETLDGESEDFADTVIAYIQGARNWDGGDPW
ncbi:MAG: hypothetical protein IPO91_33875 [Chloroflexi bacterium]|nr:hypothetical protein [Chloroflexota bacterium]